MLFPYFFYIVYIAHFTKFTRGSSLIMEKSLSWKNKKLEKKSLEKKKKKKNKSKEERKSTILSRKEKNSFVKATSAG